MKKPIVGVMGPGGPNSEIINNCAYEVGCALGKKQLIVLTGGRNQGVMDAALRGAKEQGSLTLGILPGSDTQECSNHIDIPVITSMGDARNVINVLTADVLIFVGMGPGTASELALTIKHCKPLILLEQTEQDIDFAHRLSKGNCYVAQNPGQAVHKIVEWFRLR
jgi:uncharacterized protein (TIGR00725 family)